MILNWCIPMALITVALMAPTIAGAAGSIKIWPDQLIPTDPSRGKNYQDHLLSPRKEFRSVDFSQCLQHKDGGLCSTRWERIFNRLDRNKHPVEVVLFGDGIIKAGYRYYITVYSANEDSYFWGVRINYQE